MLLIVSEGSERVPPENFPSTPTTLTISLPDAVVLIHVISVTAKMLETEHVIVWLCLPTASVFGVAMWIKGLPVN
jgi:hypothetical protein